MEAILPTRILRDPAHALPALLRTHSRPTAASSGSGGFFTRDPYRNWHFEISLNDFGLEESYGRFVQEKAYAAILPETRGSLVDLYV